MGKPTDQSRDQAAGRVEASLSATGATAALLVRGGLNVTVSGSFVATMQLERSFDGGTSWHMAHGSSPYMAFIMTSRTSFWHWEFEAGVLYRVNCTAYTSGTITVRLSY